MKTFLLLGLLAFSVQTHAAISDTGLVQECSGLGYKRLKMEARHQNRKLDSTTMRVCEIDNRRFNPWKFVYYCAEATDGMRVSVRMDKGPFGPCR